MEIKYQSGLEHQQKAIDAIVKVFDNVQINKPTQLYENPQIDFTDTKIKENIKSVQIDSQYNVDADNRKQIVSPNFLNLDVKMETGTGKTYVYTHTIYELHKRYGFNKFIVAVPTLPIKEGAKSFLGDADVKRHFSNACGYNAEIDLCVLVAKQAKKGKRMFPSEVREFVSGSHQTTNKIYVLLVNMALLSDQKNGMLSREDYDQTIQGFYKPYEALKGTHPIVIIDEPHRFSRDQKAYTVLREKIVPQCIIRFGATFPEITEGKGKNKFVRKDYENLLYNLNACQAFNQNLVKGVAKEHFESPSKKNEKIKITAIKSKESIEVNYVTALQTKSYTLYKNDSLGSVSSDMEGIVIEEIGKDYVSFSNGQTKRKGEEFDVNICSSSYQEAMIDLAIQRHFESERKNFERTQKIKTLALFFIDDIQSFRGDENGENAWLRDKFEQKLKENIEKELKKDNSTEYQEFLNASLSNLRACSAGYFAQDNSDSDEAVAKEVDDILRNKKGLLSFKDANVNWNLRRFLFSKWTLKEGWDNPNVFTITKLRSSGSEISKIQEVGRGLRLPVDEFGNRINEEFQLNYIVDFTEADFANRLVAEINGDVTSTNEMIITDEKLEEVATKLGKDKNVLFAEMLLSGFVDSNKKVQVEKLSEFFDKYPEFQTSGLNSSKITDRNRKQTNTIKIRKERFDELKELWSKVNQKYIIFFEKELNERIENDFHLSKDTFQFLTINSQRDKIEIINNGATLACDAGVEYELHGKEMPYNEFLIRISKSTSLPIKLIHKKIIEYFEANPPYTSTYINESSMANFISQFNDWKVENIKGLLNYKQANYNSKETSLTDVNGQLKDEITQGLIGITLDKGNPSAKYLYEGIAYDSELEKKNIISDIEDVIVFGKIPRRSIAIPTIIDNYSPDFMYIVKRKDGKKELNIIIETKDVEGKTTLRPVEQVKIDCAQKFFEQLKIDGYSVNFKTQLDNKKMTEIVKELIRA